MHSFQRRFLGPDSLLPRNREIGTWTSPKEESLWVSVPASASKKCLVVCRLVWSVMVEDYSAPVLGSTIPALLECGLEPCMAQGKHSFLGVRTECIQAADEGLFPGWGGGRALCFLFTVFQGRIIVVPWEESCLCLLGCLKREAQTKPSRERLRLISRHSGRELWNEYQRGNPFPKIAAIWIARSESKGIARLPVWGWVNYVCSTVSEWPLCQSQSWSLMMV